MARHDIPAVFSAVSLKPDALNDLAALAAARGLRVIHETTEFHRGFYRAVSKPVALDARAGEGDGLDAASVPGLLLDLARLGLAAAHAAYTTPAAQVGDVVSETVTAMRRAGLALPSDPGAQAPLSKTGD